MKKCLFFNRGMFHLYLLQHECKGRNRCPGSKKDDGKGLCRSVVFSWEQRCATCMAIESNTKATMKKNFADQIKKGKVTFKVIDISKKENEKIAEKYEVTWSSLFIVRHKNGKETYKNMTEFAFANARKSPDVFRAGVVKSVNEMLR